MTPRRVSRIAIIGSIVRKDFVAFSRSGLYMGLSIVGLVMYIAVFWLIPDTVNETATIGLFHHDLTNLEAMLAEGDGGVEVVVFERDDDLRAVIDGSARAWRGPDGALIIEREGSAAAAADDATRPAGSRRLSPVVGLAFPPDFLRKTAAGEATTVRVYVNDDTPAEIRTAMQSMIREIAFMLAGNAPPYTEPDSDDVVLGTDRMGAQVSLRERMRPMLAFFVLMVETFALASLIASEISQRTVTAVIATPARVSDVLAAKSIHGITLALGQAVILLAAVGAFTASNWLIVLVATVMGAAMFTSVAMIAGSSGRDFLGTLFSSMIWIIPLAIPAISALIPGSGAARVRWIPSYGVMRALVDASSYGAGWGDVGGTLAVTFGWVVLLFSAGVVTLSRKVATL